MTVGELKKALEIFEPNARVFIIKSHGDGYVSHHDMGRPNGFFGFEGVGFSIGEQIQDEAKSAGLDPRPQIPERPSTSQPENRPSES
jgi:hypothetical protein